MKLTILAKPYGYTGEALAAALEAQNIYCEFADPDYLVLMLPADDRPGLPERLYRALAAIPRRPEITAPAPVLKPAQAVLTPHAALFSPARRVELPAALGKIMADPTVSCPPAIPVVCCGERIDAWAINAMEYYGITHVRVVEG